MPRHDLLCEPCARVIEDVVFRHGDKLPCPECGHEMQTYYGNWTDVMLDDHGRARNDRVAHDGTIKNLGASDSKLARIELGLSGRPYDKALRTFSPEQSAAFRAKLMADGDSPKVFREIIETRKANQRGQSGGGGIIQGTG